MSDQASPNLDDALKSQIIHQLAIIRGHIQLVLVRYPGVTFLTESLNNVLIAADRLFELIEPDAAADTPSPD
jgi:hypothetical protein